MNLRKLFSRLFNNRGEAGTVTEDVTKLADGQSQDQSQQDGKSTGLIADIDLSDVPEEQREAVKKHLETKVKHYDSSYRSKTEDLANERKSLQTQRDQLRDLENLQKEIEGNPTLKNKVTKVINDFRAGVVEPSADPTKSIKKLDTLIQNAPDADTRESLKQMRDIIKDEVAGSSGIMDHVKKLEAKIQDLQNTTQLGQVERVDSKISQLKKRFGKEVVEKYEPELRAAGLKYPQQDMDKLFRYTADEDDVRTALIKDVETKKQRDQAIKQNGSSVNLDSVHKPLELKKDKHGRVNIRTLAADIAARYRK